MQVALETFLDYFGGLEDRRESPKIKHSVAEILLVTLGGVIAGGEGWEEMEDYGASKLERLRELLPYRQIS